MRVLEIIGIGALILLIGLLVIFARREVISRRGGTIEMNLRLTTLVPQRGWAPGLGRFVGEELHWYRLFSFAVRPRRTLSRADLVSLRRRRPQGAERAAMPDGWVVLSNANSSTELAIAESALIGFLSWIEAAPPGRTAPLRPPPAPPA
jgi:Protein of unknown function (DUF2550)